VAQAEATSHDPRYIPGVFKPGYGALSVH
jgi:hypothetical protein